MKISQLPPILLARTVALGLLARVHFLKDCIGEVHHGKDEDYEVFRKVILEPSKNQPERPKAVFIVRFRFARFTARTNRLLSLIPIPFIVAQPGFRSKTWMIGLKTGAFRGLYEWDSMEHAEKYWTSFPMRLMKSRAVQETLDYEVRAL